MTFAVRSLVRRSAVAGAALAAVGALAVGGAPVAMADSPNTATFTSPATFVAVARKMINAEVTTSGSPAPVLTQTGKPTWLHFTLGSARSPGTAHLSGNPPAGIIGAVSFTVSATNGSGTPTDQVVTLDILGFTTTNGGSFTIGQPGSFTVTVPSSLSGVSMSAPVIPPRLAGLVFIDNGDGTGTLSGTPLAGDKSTSLRVNASLGGRTVSQTFRIAIG